MKKHISEDEMTLFYYGEGADSDIAAHLEQCGLCAKEYEDLEALLNQVSADDVPDRGPDYGARIWRKIEPRLEARPTLISKIRGFFQPNNLVMVGSFALIALAAFLMGRFGPKTPDNVSFISNVVPENLLNSRVSDHLEQLQMLLTHVKHEDADDLKLRQDWARQLANDNRLYRQVAYNQGDQNMANLLDELEFTLLELANQGDSPQVEVERVEQNEEHTEILFKIRVLRSEMNPKQMLAAPSDDRAL